MKTMFSCNHFCSLRSTKGISLIALIVTIIVAIILAGIVYFSTNNALNSMSEAKFKSDLRGLMDRLKIYHEKANLEDFKYKSSLLEWNGASVRATNTGKVENGSDEDTPEYILGTIPAYFKGKLKITNGRLEVFEEDISEEEGIWVADLGLLVTDQDGVPRYTVSFDANGGSVSTDNKKIRDGSTVGDLPTPTRDDYTFTGWYTEPDGGTPVSSDTVISGEDTTIYAHWTDLPVEMDGEYYASVAAALNKINNNTERTIKLLKNISEAIIIASGRTLILDFNGKKDTITDNVNVIQNNGTLTIKNGRIDSAASGNGAINNNNHAKLNVENMIIDVTGGKQAIYNDGGSLVISGNSRLHTVSNARATVQNHTSSSSMTILDGTIISDAFYGVYNEAGTLTIGNKNDGVLSSNNPSIQGGTYGLSAKVSFNFYDGIIKGVQGAIKNEGGTVIPTDEFSIVYNKDTSATPTYNVAYVTERTIIRVAEIGSKTYESLQAAINDAPDNTETTIRLLDNITEDITVASTKNVKINMGSYKIENATAKPAITNDGTLSIINGTVQNNDYPVAILNRGTLNVSGGLIQSAGTSNSSNTNNSTVFIDNGTLNMTGGKIVSNNTGNYAYAIFLKSASATANISGTAEVISNNDTAIAINSDVTEGITLGVLDDSIDIEHPLVEGAKKGILNNTETTKVVFYDGIIKSTQDTITYSKIDTDYYIYTGVEIVDNTIYGTTYVGATAPKVASLDGTTYDTLQLAINAAKNNEKTIYLLKGTRESVKIEKNQKITFDFQGHTLANVGDLNVINTYGTVTILNGSLTSDAPKHSVIDVNAGTLTIHGTTIINRGARQAVYNNGAKVIIEGNNYFMTSAPERAALHNLNNGTMYVKSGTFIATIQQALYNQLGTVYIGDDDGVIQNNIFIQGNTKGVTTNNNANNKIYFYDGIIKGKEGIIDKDAALQSPQNGGRINFTTDAAGFSTATVVSQ